MSRSRPRPTMAALAALLASVVAGCTDVATDPAPSQAATASASPSPSPSPSSEPSTRFDVPVDCLNVLAPEILDGITAGAPYEVRAGSRIGESPYAPSFDEAFAPVDPIRSVSCMLSDADGVAFELSYLEFDPAGTDARLASLAAFGDEGEAYQPPGTDLALAPVPGIPEARQLQIPFASPDGTRTKTWVVGPGWEVYVDAPWVTTHVAAPMPGEIGAGLGAVAPVDQSCPTMLPVPTERLDLAARHGLASSETARSDGAVVCVAGEVGGASTLERALWWEEVAPDVREQLLADASAGVDGMRLQGSTHDGSGGIVAFADDTCIVVFDEHLVHLDIAIDGELALQLARHVHAPAWLAVPPVA